MAEELYPYQDYGSKFLAERETALLADAPGCGKTSQAIRACDIVKAKSILVIVPGVARVNWLREFERFSLYKRSYGIVESSKKGVPNADVLFVSYSIIRSRPVLIELLKREYDVLIADEAHYLKNPEAVTTKCVYGAKMDRSKGLASRAKRVWLLTGTPIPSNLSEFYSHARALFPGVREGLEKERSWKDFFCVTDGFGEKVVANKNVPEFVKRMKPYTLRRRVEDVLPDLPPIRISQVVIEPEKLPPINEEAKEAEAIIKNAIAQKATAAGRVEDLSQEDLKAIETVAGMHLATHRKWCGIAKAQATADLIKEDLASGMDKVVIFALHKDVFNILLKSIPGSAAINGDVKPKERDRLIDRFQGRIPEEPLNVLICHISIAATALTLTASCNVVFCESSWVPADIFQASKRCHRFGQTRPVLARIISLRNSIDEAVGHVLARKAQSISKIEGALSSTEGIQQ